MGFYLNKKFLTILKFIMTDNLGLSLDDIIKINKKTKKTASKRGRGRGGNVGNVGNKAGITRSQSASQRGRGSNVRGNRGGRGGRGGRGSAGRGMERVTRSAPTKSATGGGVQQRKAGRGRGKPKARAPIPKAAPAVVKRSKPGKLMLQNLHFKVTDQDMKELFSKFGVLKKASVHYDSKGKSLGAAEVVFAKQDNAVKALREYNNVPLDGRPMKISLVGPQNEIVTIDSRVGPMNSVQNPNKPNKRGASNSVRGAGRGRGRGGKVIGARGGKGATAAGRSGKSAGSRGGKTATVRGAKARGRGRGHPQK